jgi:hypothetical protein
VLTGAFGEGEAGPVNQPEHQYCYQLARLLLEAGADPNDNQYLYNRMFTLGTRHLELHFEFGLGQVIKGKGPWFRRLGDQLWEPSQMLVDQLGWAVQHQPHGPRATTRRAWRGRQQQAHSFASQFDPGPPV